MPVYVEMWKEFIFCVFIFSNNVDICYWFVCLFCQLWCLSICYLPVSVTWKQFNVQRPVSRVIKSFVSVLLRLINRCLRCWYQDCLMNHDNTCNWIKQQRQKTYLRTGTPNEDAYQPAYPRSLIWAFVVRMKTLCTLGYPNSAHRRFWSDCANTQDDLNLC